MVWLQRFYLTRLGVVPFDSSHGNTQEEKANNLSLAFIPYSFIFIMSYPVWVSVGFVVIRDYKDVSQVTTCPYSWRTLRLFPFFTLVQIAWKTQQWGVEFNLTPSNAQNCKVQ